MAPAASRPGRDVKGRVLCSARTWPDASTNAAAEAEVAVTEESELTALVLVGGNGTLAMVSGFGPEEYGTRHRPWSWAWWSRGDRASSGRDPALLAPCMPTRTVFASRSPGVLALDMLGRAVLVAANPGVVSTLLPPRYM